MSDDEDRMNLSGEILLDVIETPFEAEQRRGRRRMLGLWRSAVASVLEAAQREAVHQPEGTPTDDVEGYEAPVERVAGPTVVEVAPVAVPQSTWVFPAKHRPDGN